MTGARITRCGYNIARDCFFVFREDGERKWFRLNRPLNDAIESYGRARGEGNEWRELVEAAVLNSVEEDWGDGGVADSEDSDV